MSTYEFAIRPQAAPALSDLLGQLGARFWKWWLGLYADAPRNLRPMI